MVTTQESLSNRLQEFNAEHKLRGSAVVTRDGLPMVSALPASVNRETFAAMAATMAGAAETAASELTTSAASRIMVEYGRLQLVAVGAGPELLLVAVAEGDQDLMALANAVTTLADDIKRSV